MVLAGEGRTHIPVLARVRNHEAAARYASSNDSRHEARQDFRHEPRQDFRHDSRHDLRHDFRQDSRHDLRHDSRQDSRHDLRHDFRQDSRHEARHHDPDTLALYLRVTRDKEELERRLNKQRNEIQNLQLELEKQKTEEAKLRRLSEAMVKEYDQLKTKYELETGALQEAVLRATQWYKENRQLKRKSAVLMQKMMSVAPDSMTEVGDDVDSPEGDEIETLRNNMKDLQLEVARLQSEVNSLRLLEFEAQEQVVELKMALDSETSQSSNLRQQLKETKTTNENLDHVTRLACQEVSSLRDQIEKEKSTMVKLKTDADQAKKERNVLAHQSQLLLFEAASDEKLMKALTEIENLKRSLEEQQQINKDQLLHHQEMMEMQQNESRIELLEEKLKLIESELNIALQRAERAENESLALKKQVRELEDELCRSKIPPPPPPPPLPPALAPTASPRRTKQTSSVVEMANLLGIPRTAKPTLHQGAIDDIINEIKGGRFFLKTPEKPEKKKEVEEQPPALKEMMNVLGTLRKRPGNRTPSFKKTRNDISTASSTVDITI